ncbi:MAG: hypothetical protein E7244_10305 [Enterocloster citroniae]|nr:hypothetical protein [Enterocloster citroniae]
MRVSGCIGNDPTEAFWGMLECEISYLKKYYTYQEPVTTVMDYIDCHNHRKNKKRLSCMTPIEYREYLQQQAA